MHNSLLIMRKPCGRDACAPRYKPVKAQSIEKLFDTLRLRIFHFKLNRYGVTAFLTALPTFFVPFTVPLAMFLLP